MRCRDVSRAIAAPNGEGSTAELEAHLAACPRCSRLASEALRFDRLWEATRPAPPPPTSWDAAWARIEREVAAPCLASEPVAPGRPTVARVPLRLFSAGALVAAAAAVLVALNPPEPAPRMVDQAGAIQREFEVPVGHTVLYHVDSGQRQVIQVHEPPADDSLTFFDRYEAGMDAVDYFVLFNLVEALPELMASAHDGSANPFGPLP
ncbi:hypothetical protein [Tautonia sociabilis]|uniref:Zinc-finger domain-containing protein n=1 Tax=Tautonia sociabilis TaxID=2080755 RepID=A0A432MEA7_9BACT|nr:hypothetical protein [Tautonia sociabilis]RUL83646.1 hypothetical protein TsocGM_21675 [Tautonia sociabilis]